MRAAQGSLIQTAWSNPNMPLVDKMSAMEKPKLLGCLAPVICLLCIAVAILLSPWFNWVTRALSDLGNYDNGILPAVVFNVGLILTGILELYFVQWFIRQLDRVIAKVAMAVFAVASIFLILIGVLSENAFEGLFAVSPHFVVSVGFFFSFPFAMWIMSVELARHSSLLWFALISSVLPFFSVYIWWITFTSAAPWTGMAIPEILTATTAIGWVWLLWLLHHTGRLSTIVAADC